MTEYVQIAKKELKMLRETLNDAIVMLDEQAKTAHLDCGENAIVMHKPYFQQARHNVWQAQEIIDHFIWDKTT
jgi:hypothetical protein